MSLRAFLLVAEYASYTRAAEHLGLTHAAVMHQVRTLERRLGAKLVQRSGNGVRCSPAGAELLVKLRPPMRSLEDLFGTESRGAGQTRITIGTVPAFANGWLIPRLPRLAARFPLLDFQLRPELALVDLRASGVDLVVRHGSGYWEGLQACPLLTETVFPVGSPSSPALARVRCAADLANAVLIENPLLSWRDWFLANGLPATGGRFALTVPDSYSAQLAAEAGVGVALGRQSLVEPALSARRLTRLEIECEALQVQLHVALLRSRARERLLLSLVDALLDMVPGERRRTLR